MWVITGMPLALLLLTIMALLVGAMECGLNGHRWLRKRFGHVKVSQAVPDHLLAAMLGLLALLLGFTFSLALSRYETRRELVVDEANAIGTSWLRVQLLEDPARARLIPRMREYVEARVIWSNDPAPEPDIGGTVRAQQQLWVELGFAVRHDSSEQLTRGLMDAMNESFDLASARAAARAAHVPAEVLFVLLGCAMLTALMLGYVMPARQHLAATVLLLALLSITLTMIVDLERPVGGAIRISQEPLTDLRNSMR